MTRRMSGRREKGHATVAEYIMVPLQLCDGMAGLEAGLVISAGPFVFGLLDVEHCRGKHLDVADMVGMGVRDGHGLDVRRRDAKLVKLRRQRLRPAPENGLWIGRSKAIWHGCDRIRYPGVPEEPTLGMLDQIAGVDEIH